MVGTFLVLLCSMAAAWGAYSAWGLGLGITFGIVALIVAWVVLGLALRRASMSRQMKIQAIMEEAQNKINRQIENFSRRPQSSANAIRPIIEKMQRDATLKALEAADDFKPLYKWSFMMERQITAMKVQLYFQLRDNKMVDELLPKALMMDPQTVGIQLVRMYRTDSNKLDKFFKSTIRRFRGDQRAFIACVYAWIKLKKDDVTAALNAMIEARKLSDNPVLLNNIEQLSNGKVKHFSNSGFNEMWYALMLEEPRAAKPQRHSGRMF